MPIETSMIKRTNENNVSSLSWILLAIILAAIGTGAYFFLMKPKADKTVGTITPMTQYAAQQIQDIARPKSYGENYDFDDGLRKPVSEQKSQLNEMGQGIANIDIFTPDINNDGLADKITRTRNENGTAHFYYNYKIELNTGTGFVDITPNGFRTTEGAGCALQKLRFVFIPNFMVVKISRNWRETWDAPTMAVKTIYKMNENNLGVFETKQMNKICNVSDLF